MKILYLHQYFNTPAMPGGTRSYEMARRLVDLGHDVHVLTADVGPAAAGSVEWRTSVESGIQVHWIGVPYDNRMGFRDRVASFLRFAWLSARRAVAVGGDILFATSTPLTIAIPAIYASRRLQIPMVFEVRDLWPAVPIEMGVLRNPILIWLARRLERAAYRNSERIVALAPGMKDAVVATGFPEHRVAMIPNGADLSVFQVPVADGLSLRRTTPWLKDRPLVLYAGALGAVNGLDFLVALATEMLKVDSEVCFAIIGAGREEARIRAASESAGVLGRNLFLLGPKPKVELPRWLSAASAALAFISGPEILWRNATQNKFFDALAAGRPVVCNFRGFQSVVAEDAGCGLILDSTHPAAAAAALAAKLRDPEWLREAAARSLQLAVERFDRDVLARQLNDTLELAASDFRARRHGRF